MSVAHLAFLGDDTNSGHVDYKFMRKDEHINAILLISYIFLNSGVET